MILKADQFGFIYEFIREWKWMELNEMYLNKGKQWEKNGI